MFPQCHELYVLGKHILECPEQSQELLRYWFLSQSAGRMPGPECVCGQPLAVPFALRHPKAAAFRKTPFAVQTAAVRLMPRVFAWYVQPS